MKKHVTGLDILYGAALGILFSLFVWQEINFKFIPFSVTVLGIMEIGTQLKWRLSLTCKKCGFDPLLYLKSPDRAAAKVREQFTRRMEDPNLLNKHLPVMNDLKRPARALTLQSSNKVGHKPQNKLNTNT